MPSLTNAVVLGVLPEKNTLPGQVHACLDRAASLLTRGQAEKIVVIGGYGHGADKQSQRTSEAQMMKDSLIRTQSINPRSIITIDTPVTLPEVLWEVRKLNGNCRILTIKEKRPRIQLPLNMIVAGRVTCSIEEVPYICSAKERFAGRHEQYLLQEARQILAAMTPGDEKTFQKLYSFKHHLWAQVVKELKQ